MPTASTNPLRRKTFNVPILQIRRLDEELGGPLLVHTNVGRLTTMPLMKGRVMLVTSFAQRFPASLALATQGSTLRPHFFAARACWYIERWIQVQTPAFFQARK